MVKCSFCQKSIEKGTGKMFVYASGKIINFCTNKCEKNLLKLKRKPLKVKWTGAYQQEKQKKVPKKETKKVVKEDKIKEEPKVEEKKVEVKEEKKENVKEEQVKEVKETLQQKLHKRLKHKRVKLSKIKKRHHDGKL